MDSAKFKEELDKLGFKGCPICGSTTISISNHPGTSEPLVESGPGGEVLPVICGKCSYVMLFSTQQGGMVKLLFSNPQPDESA
jgi:hypothetical protein